MNYPILHIFKDDNRIFTRSNFDESHRISQEFLGLFENSTIIDSCGVLYEIQNVVSVGWGTPLWGFSLLKKSRTVKIDYIISNRRHIDLNEFKNIVLYTLRGNVDDFWYSHNDFPILEDRIKQSNSYMDLINIFVCGFENY